MPDFTFPAAARSDDPQGGPSVKLCLGPLVVSAVIAAALDALEVFSGSYALILMLLVLVATAVTTRIAIAASDKRAGEHMTACLTWLWSNAGIARFATVAGSHTYPGSLTQYVETWKRVRSVTAVDDEAFTDILRTSIDARQFHLPESVLALGNGHHKQVTGPELAALLGLDIVPPADREHTPATATAS